MRRGQALGLVVGSLVWSVTVQAQQPSSPSSPSATPNASAEPPPLGDGAASDQEVTPGPSGQVGTGPENEQNGLMVLLRPSASLSGDVTVTLKGASETVSVSMNDAGKPPDVRAGDGIWAGVVEAAPQAGRVTLKTSSGSIEGGRVEWAEDDRARELQLGLADGKLTVEATVHQGAAPVASSDGAAPDRPEPVAPGEAPGGVVSGGEGALPPSDGEREAPVPPTAGAAVAQAGEPVVSPVAVVPRNEPSIWAILPGVLALVLAAAALWVGLRRRGSDAVPASTTPAKRPMPTRMSEPGLLGTGTPAATAGVSIWTGPGALMRPLLAHLARGRPVVVATGAGASMPAVLGGPIFHVESLAPDAVAAAVQALQQRGCLSVGVMVLAEKPVDEMYASSLGRALPADVGAVVWGRSLESGCPVVVLSPAPNGAGVSVDGTPLRTVRTTVHGFEWD